MPAKCPHCTKDIDSLTGFVDEDTLRSRLAAKQQKIDALNAQLSEGSEKVSGYDALKAERDQLLARASSAERRIHTAQAGLSAEAHDVAEYLYGKAMSNVPKADKKDFDAWLGSDGQNHVMLKPHFASSASTQAVATQTATTQATEPAAAQAATTAQQRPNGNAGAATAARSAGLTPQQVQEVLMASIQTATTPEKRAEARAKLGEMMAQVSKNITPT